MKVPFFPYPQVFNTHEEAFVRIFKDVGRRGAFIMQQDLRDFEAALAQQAGTDHAVGLANATDGLEMLMRIAGFGTGDEVILCSHTMIATASAVHDCGATAIPVDAGADHLIDPEAIKAAITPKTKAIMPTQLNGRVADMDAVCAIAEEHDLLLLEDSAQALGAKYKNKGAGSFGLGGCISFYPAKTLGCLGDGGAVVTNDEDVYNKLILMRDHGRDATGNIPLWGRNSRLDNLQAAFLLYLLEHYPQSLERRREIAARYEEGLKDIDALTLPPSVSEEDRYDIFQNYEIEADDRDALREHLTTNTIGTLIQWGGKAVHHFKDLGFTQELPNTDRLFERMIMLPMNQYLTNDEVDYVIKTIREYYPA